VPGAGKTTQLGYKLIEKLNNGNDIFDICFCTFSKSQANDIKDRISQKVNIERKELNHSYFGTIHHCCVKLLDWDLKNKNPSLATDLDKAKFLSKWGFNYPIKSDNPKSLPESILTDDDVSEATDEEKIFSVINWCNQRLISLKNWKKSNISFYSIDPGLIYDICKSWNDYKHHNDLVDFDDMLLEIVKNDYVPSCKILFVDEFQDLTPLLHKVISIWGKDVEESFYVAGDDDQTIYTWSGANPDYLLNFNAQTQILSESFRVPSEIITKANSLIETISNRQNKQLSSKKNGGAFIYLKSPTKDDILDHIEHIHPEKTIYFLFRTNYLADMWCKEVLLPFGIPYKKLKPGIRIPDPWSKKVIALRNLFVKLKGNISINKFELKTLIKILPSCSRGRLDSYVRWGKKRSFDEDTNNEFTLRKILTYYLTKIPTFNSNIVQREFNDVQRVTFNQNLSSKYSLFNPYNIRVGTLHSAKGLEADVVFVFNNHGQKTEQSLIEHGQHARDCETRLYYVGITRAKETCFLVDDFFNKYVFGMEEINRKNL